MKSENKIEMLGGTVSEAIDKAGIKLDELDYVDVELDKNVSEAIKYGA
mgnify:CR=1 FL=1